MNKNQTPVEFGQLLFPLVSDMSVLAYIENTYGPEYAAKCRNRRRGGDNNAKGNAFEDQFAVYKIASLYTADHAHLNSIVTAQANDPVDDLVITNDALSEQENCQLKNALSVSWGQPTNGIAHDFNVQHDINTNYYGKALSKTTLVVAYEDIHTQLSASCPTEIAAHTSCIHFKNEPFNSLLVANDPQIEPFKQLCAFPEETDKVTKVWQALLGAWATLKSAPTSIAELVRVAAEGYKPGYFKTEAPTEISAHLQERLDRIEELVYSVRDGYLSYTIRRMFSGSFQLNSQAFVNFEQELLKPEHKNINWNDLIQIIGRGE